MVCHLCVQHLMWDSLGGQRIETEQFQGYFTEKRQKSNTNLLSRKRIYQLPKLGCSKVAGMAQCRNFTDTVISLSLLHWLCLLVGFPLHMAGIAASTLRCLDFRGSD